MILQEDDLEFDFTDAIDAMKFDDCEHKLSHCMKAVDFVVEVESAYLFVEVKDPSNPMSRSKNYEQFKENTEGDKLRNDLTQKFRDTFIYRWAEEMPDKSIHFLSLITLEEGLLRTFQDKLHRHLPYSNTPDRWKRQIIKSCHTITLDDWNRNFPKWPVKRISGDTEA